jgi:hypothetical protein
MTTDKLRIPYTKPSITDLEVRYATDAATKGWDAYNDCGDHCVGASRNHAWSPSPAPPASSAAKFCAR